MGDHRGFLFMFSMRNHTKSCTYITFFSNLLRAMFILQRTNFVSTKNIDNCVLLFLYVLPIDDQAEVRRNADIQVPEGCHWPSLLYWMNDGGEGKKITWLLWSWRHLLRTCLYIETGAWGMKFNLQCICWIHLHHCLWTKSLASKEIHVSTFNKRVNFVKLQP